LRIVEADRRVQNCRCRSPKSIYELLKRANLTGGGISAFPFLLVAVNNLLEAPPLSRAAAFVRSMSRAADRYRAR
jgi:hypothetical protein